MTAVVLEAQVLPVLLFARTSLATGSGYFLEQSTRPQTIGYSLLNSPVGLAA